MEITITVVTPDEPPAEGTPLVVEVRDTSLQDAHAPVLSRADLTTTTEAEAAAPDAHHRVLGTAHVTVPDDPGAESSVFAHVSADGADEVSPGDYITVQSYPVSAETPELLVEVVRIG